jgi:4'-phosphopantetheinyl transferase
VLSELRAVLDEDELQRAARFRSQQDSERFTVAHGTLRLLLARYLGIEPSELVFCSGEHGKPFLAPEVDHADIKFNIAHSDGLALYAFSRDREVGVDVERMQPVGLGGPSVVQFFSRHERAVLHKLPPSLQQSAFYACWTRKEAYIKARGVGLSIGLDQFEVSLRPDKPARLRRVRGEFLGARRWSLRHLEPGPGYAGAVAVEGRGWRLKCWQVPDLSEWM